jgi:hypothetical protein
MAQLYGPVGKVSKTGDTMSGDLILGAGTPAEQSGAVPKAYVDAGFACVVIFVLAWPSRPQTPAVALWIGGTTSPPVGGSAGAQPNDVWLQNTIA